MAKSERVDPGGRQEPVKVPKKTYDAVRPHGGTQGGVSSRRFLGGRSLEPYSRVIDFGLLGITFLLVLVIVKFWNPSRSAPPPSQQTSATSPGSPETRSSPPSPSRRTRGPASVASSRSTMNSQRSPSTSVPPRSERSETESRSSASERGFSAPTIIHQSQPSYTPEARAARFTRPIAVALTVDENGVPQEIALVAPAPFGLGERAIAAVRDWRYEPASKNGKPIRARIVEEVRFH